jgi:pimeloyl-ACP methyl ester carboxylesterase
MSELVNTRFRIKTPEGMHLSVDRRGTGTVSCVFFHGLAEGGYVWDDIRAAIAPSFSSVAIDLRGHGYSDWAKAGEYNLCHYISDIRSALAQLNLSDFILIGHSLGGSIIAHAWRQIHAGLRAVVLVDVPTTTNPEMLAMLRKRIRDGYREYNSVEEYAGILRAAQPLINPSAAHHLAANSLTPTTQGALRFKFDLEVVDNDFDRAGEWLPGFCMIDLPVLLIRGAGSAVLSKRHAEQINAGLRKSSLKSVEMAGHAVMSDNPLGFYAALMPFLLSLRETS